MKAISNIGRESIPYAKEAIKGTLKAVTNTPATEVMLNKNCHEIEDRIDITPKKESFSFNKMFSYKPSLSQQVAKNIVNYQNYQRFEQNSGLNMLYRSFSSLNKPRIDKMEMFADPTNDVAFKKIFSTDNKEGIKDFLESVIICAKEFPFSTKLEKIEFLNKDHMPDVYHGKKSLCDLKVEDDKGNIFIVEMQKRNEQNYLQRIQYYSAHAVTDQLEQGIAHAKIQPVITVSIMGRECFGDDIPCISYHPFKETTTNKQLLVGQSHIFIELSKLEKSSLNSSTLEWLSMFKEASNLNEMPKVENEFVKKAYQKLERHNWNSDEMKAYIDSKIDDDMEKNNIEHALQQGKIEGKIEIAKQMRSDGEPTEKIQKYTGLSKEKIDKL